MSLTVRACRGAEAEQVLDAVSALRIEVFREFPYLYDGTAAYESEYLASYAACEEAVIVVAEEDGAVVGASTALPLLAHSDDVVPAFVEAGIDPATVYYFGESVLRRAYRKRGLGHAFFDHRERTARELGKFTLTSFCAVVRPDDHPRRPPDYVPHDAFWSKRGYTKQPSMVARFAWKEVGADVATSHDLVFWTRPVDR